MKNAEWCKAVLDFCAILHVSLFKKNVISLQKLDALLKADIKKGLVRIEKTEIIGVDDKEYDL